MSQDGEEDTEDEEGGDEDVSRGGIQPREGNEATKEHGRGKEAEDVNELGGGGGAADDRACSEGGTLGEGEQEVAEEDESNGVSQLWPPSIPIPHRLIS